MKKITVISGKGGTGKTTVSSNLACLADNAVLADCDVDAPNLHLLLKPEIQRQEIFKGAKLAVREENKCINCGICVEACHFKAISPEIKVNPIKCEGCGLCVEVCPTAALQLVEVETGLLYQSNTKYGPMVHAKLKVGAENSGKLVAEVREKAEKIAREEKKDYLLIDGSPGIGCPVIASLNGADLALIVTEPTKSALADLKRLYDLVKHFGIKALVVINKYDLNETLSLEVEKFCSKEGIKVIGRIPFDPFIVESLRRGELLLEYQGGSRSALAIKAIWEEIKRG